MPAAFRSDVRNTAGISISNMVCHLKSVPNSAVDVVELLAVADGVQLLSLLHSVVQLLVRCETYRQDDGIGGNQCPDFG